MRRHMPGRYQASDFRRRQRRTSCSSSSNRRRGGGHDGSSGRGGREGADGGGDRCRRTAGGCRSVQHGASDRPSRAAAWNGDDRGGCCRRRRSDRARRSYGCEHATHRGGCPLFAGRTDGGCGGGGGLRVERKTSAASESDPATPTRAATDDRHHERHTPCCQTSSVVSPCVAPGRFVPRAAGWSSLLLLPAIVSVTKRIRRTTTRTHAPTLTKERNATPAAGWTSEGAIGATRTGQGPRPLTVDRRVRSTVSGGRPEPSKESTPNPNERTRWIRKEERANKQDDQVRDTYAYLWSLRSSPSASPCSSLASGWLRLRFFFAGGWLRRLLACELVGADTRPTHETARKEEDNGRARDITPAGRRRSPPPLSHAARCCWCRAHGMSPLPRC